MEEHFPFQIYSASAGSGKTYTLVKVYLSLVLGKDASSVSKIMAMTFTNKAALEMKSRIIKALDDLSNPFGVGKSEKEQKNAVNYQKEIAKYLRLDVPHLQMESQRALNTILHQYEDFYVMTIDKFNLRLIRSFAMDLDLDANFRVIINEDEIMKKVIDNLLDEIDPQFSSVLSKMFYTISLNRISDGKGWNFEKELYKYAEILKNESASQLIHATGDELLSKDKFIQIKNEIELLRNRLEGIVGNFRPYFEKNVSTVIADGKKLHGSTSSSLLKKLAGFDASKKESFSELFNGKIVELIVGERIESPHGEQIKSYYDAYSEVLSKLVEALKVKESYYYLVLLKEIQKKLDVFRKEEQVIRISEFNRMISNLLRNENSFFIYEKLGTRFNHFLLDEFQDTSRLQWLNMVPLLHESISHGHLNLIVGDAKQAIYRFRDGLAQQFVALPKLYNPENDRELYRLSSYYEKMGKKNTLEVNYRSNKEIVDFNSDFFQKLVDFIQSNLGLNYTEYYNDVHQRAHQKQNGYVELVTQIEPKKKKEDEVEEEEGEDALSNVENTYLLNKVEECIRDGYAKGDICVLGSKRKWCNEYALTLSNAGYSVVSVDSLAVDSDQSVRLCLLYFQWRSHPTNELLAKRFITRYLYLHFQEEATRKYIGYFRKKRYEAENGEREIEIFDYNAFILDYFQSMEAFFCPFENLYALVQKFYLLSGFSELHNPYLHHLSDLAFNFDMSHGPDLDAFIDYYESNGKDSSIQTPENKEAIKIMTAHKSKGLEFKVVIIPQINEKFMGGNQSAHLVKMGDELAYTTLSKESKSSALSEDYTDEFRAALLDKLNLYYVAFTRAEERLYILNYLQNRKKGSEYFGSIVHDFIGSESFGYVPFSQTMNGDEIAQMEYQFGEKIPQSKEYGEDISSRFVPTDVSDRLWFPSISLRKHLLETEEGISEQIRYGKQLHQLLSEYSQTENVEVLLNRFLRKGWVEKEFENRLKDDLSRIVENETFKALHQGSIRILNEQSILVSEEEVIRPDKIILKEDETVIVDFKTGLPSPKHGKQVKNYCKILSETGMKNVRGYLLYTRDLRFVEVENE